MDASSSRPGPDWTPGRGSWQNRLHLAVAVSCGWLIVTSPWVAMLHRIPDAASWFDYAHVVLGCVVALLALVYGWICLGSGRWRTYFPWVAGDVRAIGHDVKNLLRARFPSADGGGLYSAIEGLLLVALLVTGLSGVTWLAMQGSASLAWRSAHLFFADFLIGLVIVHVLAVATHLFELA